MVGDAQTNVARLCQVASRGVGWIDAPAAPARTAAWPTQRQPSSSWSAERGVGILSRGCAQRLTDGKASPGHQGPARPYASESIAFATQQIVHELEALAVTVHQDY